MSDIMKDALKKAVIQNKDDSNKAANPGKKTQGGPKGNKPITKKKTPLNISNKLRGQIKWFNLHNGYGFVKGEDGNEYFIHASNISSGRTYIGFEASDLIEFRVSANPNGGQPRAVNAELVLDDDNGSEETELVTDDQGDQTVEDPETETE